MDRERYRIDDLVVDVGAVHVLRDGAPLAVPPLSFALFVALLRRAPDVVAPEALIAAVWPNTAVADETLTQRVKLLRRALGDDAADPRYVRSVRGHGYQIAAPVQPDGPPSDAQPPDVTPTPRRRVNGTLAAAMVVVVAAMGVAGIAGGPWAWRGASPSTERPRVITGPATHGEILARADAYRARHTETANELAIELYRSILDADPAHADARAGLSFGLSQRATKFNQPSRHALDAAALARQVLAQRPDHAEAQHALALALDATGHVSKAISAYARAFELDPTLTNARASRAHLLQVSGRLAEALQENLAVLEAGVQRAPYLEVQIGTTLGLLGFDDAAETWLGRAVTLQPDNVFAALAFARWYLSQGRFDDAGRLAAVALEQGVVRPELWITRADAALARGDRPAARLDYARATDVAPHRLQARGRLLAAAALHGTNEGDAAAEITTFLNALQNGREAGDEWPNMAYGALVLHAARRETDAAVAALDEAVVLGFRDVGWLGHDPLLAPIRDTPTFRVRVDHLRTMVATERQRVLEAPWLPPGLLASHEEG